MRGLLILSFVAMLAAAFFSAVRSATGDALSAALVELMLFITLAGSFSRLEGGAHPAGRP
ncbi:MAG: hypothetical protein JOZ90_00585 [Alphaproteobacteria bacterium]|nr:hypothetical protein [Alphaproteobacteria bacterium]MBV9372281.1 hypothetical protein [Alphaproteobacteria bacterium]MBV9899573.1 hypothetical protein [Alphaproteobacteria bacterium]